MQFPRQRVQAADLRRGQDQILGHQAAPVALEQTLVAHRRRDDEARLEHPDPRAAGVVEPAAPALNDQQWLFCGELMANVISPVAGTTAQFVVTSSR